jgi:site-specific DNA-cytosine methylase
MRVLELFSGTGSVSKVCKELGYEVFSLDLKGADINVDILNWNYKTYPVGHFDIIWASPPCDTFSQLRKIWYGRKLKCHTEIFSKELEMRDRETIGLPILKKTEEIINYFQPALWFIENPKTGAMKQYIDRPFFDVDYCMYGDFGYKKSTRIWSNKKDFNPLVCDGNCDNMIDGKHKLTMCASRKRNQDYIRGGGNNRNDRYRIPEKLIKSLL